MTVWSFRAGRAPTISAYFRKSSNSCRTSTRPASRSLPYATAFRYLITARLLKGKRATGWKSLVVDIEDAGATYVNEPLVTSDQYIFSRQPTDLGFFCDAIIRTLKGENLQPLVEMARAI